MRWEDKEYMPPKRATKRKTIKDAEPSELIKKAEEAIGKTSNFWNCSGPITINNNHQTKPKQEIIPENPTNHWTINKHDIRWLHLWHIEQQINRLQFEFHKTVNWKEYKKIQHLNKAKKALIESGTVLETITNEELLRLYYNREISTLKNYSNHYFQYCYYELPEEGEIVEEVLSSQGRKINNGHKY